MALFKKSEGINLEEAAHSSGRLLGDAVLQLMKDQKEFFPKTIQGDNLERQWYFNIALYYIVVDRVAYSLLSEENRTAFCNKTLETTLLYLSECLDIQNNEVRDAIVEKILQGTALLEPFTKVLIPDKDENPKDTLFWEYGKILSAQIDYDDPEVLISEGIAAVIGLHLQAEVQKILS